METQSVLAAAPKIKFSRRMSDYVLAKVSLVRAACPVELLAEMQNKSIFAPIIIERNRHEYGKVNSTGYCPKAVVIAGAARRKALLDQGAPFSWAWVEAGAMEIQADHEISCQELMEKLNASINDRLYGPGKSPGPNQAWPTMTEVYPFENYMIFSFKGQKYRQHFILDPVERRVKLNGGSTAVKEINADAMARVQTGVRYAVAPPMGNNQSSTTGGATSELLTCIVRNWANIHEAANMYTLAIQTGLYKPMRPAFAPVNLSPDGRIAGALAAAGIDIVDFVCWSIQAQKAKTKRVANEDLGPGAFAYVGDKNDPSTWHLPVKFKSKEKSASHVRDALARVNQTKHIPGGAKLKVLGRLRKHAEHHGIDVSTKPTSKQKAWVKASGRVIPVLYT